MANDTRNPSSVQWLAHASIGKRNSDIAVIEAMKKHGLVRDWMRLDRQIKIVSLTGDNLEFESRLAETYKQVPMEIIPVENNKVVVEKLKRAIEGYVRKHKGFAYMRTAPKTLVRIPTEPVDIRKMFAEVIYGTIGLANLDFMGTWGLQKLETLRRIFSSKSMAPHHAIAITIMAGRGNNETYRGLETSMTNNPPTNFDFGEPIGASSVFRLKTEGVARAVVQLAAEQNIIAKPILFLPYSGLSKRTEYRFLFDCQRAEEKWKT